jgi:hypothetical protein
LGHRANGKDRPQKLPILTFDIRPYRGSPDLFQN